MVYGITIVGMLCFPAFTVEDELCIALRKFRLADVELHADALLVGLTEEGVDVWGCIVRVCACRWRGCRMCDCACRG